MASLVQSKSNTGGLTVGGNLTVTLTSPTTAGNTLLVQVAIDGATSDGTVASIALGGAGSAWFADVTETPTIDDIECWSSWNIAGGVTTVTVTIAGGSGTQTTSVFVQEWSGLGLTRTFDKSNNKQGTPASTSWTSNSTGTLTQAQEVAVGAVYSAASSITAPGSPWTELTQQVTGISSRMAVGWQILSATTSLAYAGTQGTSVVYAAAIATYMIPQAPVVTTASVPNGTTGVAYSTTLAESGGTPSFTWSLNTGSLPPGLTLSAPLGTISGTPQTAGTYNFTVKVTDSNSLSGTSGTLTIIVSNNLTVTTTSLPAGYVGVAYSQGVSSSGGFGADTWALNTGSLPAGLSLSSAGAITGTPTTTGTSTFTVKVTDSGTNTATSVSLSITINPHPIASIVNQWPLADTGGYAPAPISVANTEGNALVAVIAVGSDNVSGFCPRVSISDDAHNWWTLAGSQTVTTAGLARRLDVWVCENARAASTVSVTASQIYAGITGNIVEVNGAPGFVGIDFVGHDTAVSGTSSTLSGTATQADFVLSALALFGSNATQTVTYPASLSINSTPVSTAMAATDMSDIQLFAAYNPNVVTPGAVSEAWSWNHTAKILGLVIGFSVTPPVPVQPNPQYPAIITEAAFGFSPGNQTGGNPTWTNISSRAVDDSGNTTLSSIRGREFELTQPEAGSLGILVNNLDGALNPLNSSSPFYPNVVPEVPLRSSMYWNGRRYGVGFSYATAWPQTFPYPQWGFVPYTGKDAISIISQGSMPSAYGGEVLADFASTYFVLGEFYDGAHGSQFGNSSRFNQTPMIGWSPVSLPPPATGNISDYALQTGGTLGLLGDPNSGVGISGIQLTDLTGPVGGGVFTRDNSLPQFWGTANGVTYDFWTTGATGGNGSAVNVFSGFGPAWNFVSGTNIASGQVLSIQTSPASGGLTSWSLTVSTRAETGSGPGSPQTVTLTKASGNWTVPAGVTTLTSVECWGGATGGVVGSANNAGVGSNAGSGGAYAKSTSLAVTPLSSIPYIVAQGTAGGTGAKPWPHSVSTPTSWNSGQVKADSSTATPGGPSTPGTTAPGLAINSVGGTVFDGGQGGTGAQVNTGAGGGGGGSSASPTSAGAFGSDAFDNFGASGGALAGAGSGGNGANYPGGTGGAGQFPGGGGGGGASGGGYGGAGANGKIVLTFTPTVSNAGNEIALVTGTSAAAATYYVVLTCQEVGGNYVFTLYVNGVQICSASPAAPTTDLLVNSLALGPVPLNGGALLVNNYAVGQLAAYPNILSAQRITSHYNTGIYARQHQNGDTTSQRVSALMQWSGIGAPYGVALLDSMSPSAIGNADQIEGSALVDALYALTIDEGGMFYAPATALGEIWYAPRQTFYNQPPKVALGDNPIDISNTNPNFNLLNGWSLTSVTGTDAADSTVPGGHSATFTVGAGSPTSATALYRSPCTAGQTYMLNGYINPVTVSSTNLYSSQISWFQSNGTHISDSISTGVNLPNGAWTLSNEGTWSVPVTAPAGAAFCTFGPRIANGGGIANGTQFKAGQFWLTCVSSEIPYQAGSGFDYSDTYLYNIVSSQRTISVSEAYYIDPATGQATQQQYATNGVNAVAADLASETQYFPRGPLQLPIETTSDLDAYDRANWSLAKYKQPQLRANEVSVDLASNPGAIDAIMRLEQGSIVTVNRRPLGAPVISLNCLVQKIELHAGPDVLTVILTLSPYFPDNAVLRLDGGPNSFLGSTSLPW